MTDDPTTMPPLQNNSEHPQRLRLGFVVDWLRDSYQQTVLSGVAARAREENVQLVVLPGGVIGAEHDHGSRRNHVYRLIDPETYDGLVMLTGTLGNARTTDVVQEVCPGFPARRICHVAVEVADSPAVLIDNVRGVRKMIEHLVWVHRCRRIAFIRGPVSNPEARARYQAYCDALEAADIEFDPRLIVPGDFRAEAGIHAVRTLLDERGVDNLDAIVSTDDTMAIAALGELKRRGVRVPSEVAVVGFDDVDEARYASPPLTTVHQPLAEQGRMAVDALLDNDRSEAKPIVLETSERFRRSCGCTAEDPGFLTMRPKSETRLSLLESVQRRRPLLVGELGRSLDRRELNLAKGWEDDLIDAFQETLGDREEAFREAFDELLEHFVESGADPGIGHTLISALRRHLSVCAGDDPTQIRQVEGILHDARILTTNAVGRLEARRRHQVEEEALILGEVASRLGAATPGTVEAILDAELPRLGIERYLLCSYDSPNTARVVAHRATDGEIRALPGHTYPARDLCPAGAGDCLIDESLLVHPLDDGAQAIGFVILPLSQVASHQFELLRTLFSVALSRAE